MHYLGGGYIAQKKYFLFDDLFTVECCYDNDKTKWGDVLYDVPIRKWEKQKNTAYIIITVVSWEEIALQLEEEGLELVKDYLPFYVFDDLSYASLYYLRKNYFNGKYLNKELDYSALLADKKLAVTYGNCQTIVYEKALRLNSAFREEFMIISIPRIFEYTFEAELIEFFLNDKKFWNSIGLFIYQYVSENNRFFDGLSSELCLKKLSATCEKVAIVSMEFEGYFPQVEKSWGGIFLGYRDKYIDALMQQNLEVDEIIRIIGDEDFISDTAIENCMQNSLSKLKKCDSFADVKIYDYIEHNCMEEQLFFHPRHPCDHLLIEYAKRIFSYLNLKWDITDEDFAMIGSAGIMRGDDIVIYPSVIKKLNLKRYEKRFYFNREFISESMTLDFKQCMEIYMRYMCRIRVEL